MLIFCNHVPFFKNVVYVLYIVRLDDLLNKRSRKCYPAGIRDVEVFGLYKGRVGGRDVGGCFCYCCGEFVFLLCIFVSLSLFL